jgi:hypothetical protein
MELSKKEKLWAWIGSLAIVGAWIAILFAFVFLVILIGYDFAVGSSNVKLTTATTLFLLSINALIVIFGAIYVFFVFLIKCPSCKFQLLRNTKGLGPTSFQPHPSCPKKKGYSPWSYQIWNVVKNRKIKCLQCGRDFDLA